LSQNIPAFVLYILVAFFCCGAAIYMSSSIRHYADHSQASSFFLRSLICLALLALTDLIHAFWVFGILAIPDWGNYIIDTVYLLACFYGAALWFLYSEYAQNSAFSRSEKLRLLIIIPTLAGTVLALINPFFPIFFSYSGNVYSREAAYLWCLLVNGLLLLYTGISAVIRSRLDRYYGKRIVLRNIFVSALLFLAGHIFQLFFRELPIRTLFFTVVFIIAQDQMLKNNVYRDRTAQINNRLVMDNYLTAHFDSADSSFCFGVMEITDLRKIQDSYGRNVSDLILLLTARALKITAGAAVVARYDESAFAFSGHFDSCREIEVFLAAFRKKLVQYFQEQAFDFDLSFHIGYARKSSEVSGIQDLISRAEASSQNKQTSLSLSA